MTREAPIAPAEYLEAARRRLRWLEASRGIAVTASAMLVLTAGLAWLIMSAVPSASTVSWMRLALLGVLAGAALLMIRWPSNVQRAAGAMEARVPAFGGRLVTWLDAFRRGPATPLFALLTRQTTTIAGAYPVDRAIPAHQLLQPWAVALVAMFLLGMLLAGGHPWQLAAQRLWAGDLLAAAQPGIHVAPGDTVVRRGSDVVVDARARGFMPDDMDVHASFSGGGWERAPMSRTGEERYGFVFVGVGEEIEYYVSARGLTSTRHRIRVADLPEITDIDLSYRFPAWTGLAEANLEAGDVTALAGTRVEVTATADRALEDAVLVVNGQPSPMTADGNRAVGRFEVKAPGSWHVAVRHRGDLARISDTWLIEVAEDEAPEVAFTFPGHDRKATPIEEVVLGFSAEDDYGVESLTLSYAVNGGSWTQVPLQGAAGEHLLALESLRATDDGGERALAPGDVISLYGEARDHTRSSRSALYFVDVRPFDMRYRESQQMGGGGPSEGGGFDIAERQRDILTATWNLINERDANGSDTTRALEDQAEVLAMLQRTLRDQVQTLLSRSQARGLGREADVSEFLQALGAAVPHMEPAARRLESLELMDAVPLEQQALRHLVTAESSVRDVDVSLSRSNNRGTAGESLGELIELEMDPERNRYEMPQQPTFGEEAGADEGQEDWRRLEELAARQERLDRQRGRDPDSLPSRWEQARLQRELQEMRRELETRRARGGGSASSETLGRAIAELSEAERALERRDSEPDARERAADALRRAAGTLRESSRGNLQERLDRAGRQAGNLEADQQRVMEALETLQQEALDRARDGQALGRSDYAMQTFGSAKRRMQDDLAELRGEMTRLSDSLSERDPDAARVLDRALRELDDARVDERLAASAEAFEMGQPLYVIGSESLVSQALERLGGRIGQARDAVARSGSDDAADPLDDVRDLRRQLAGARRDDGTLAAEEVAAVARSLARLAPEAGSRQDGGGVSEPRSGLDDGIYTIRGVASENTPALYRMTLERLDLIEAALERRDSPPIRAQDPRDAARDSAAAARYFRDLSREVSDDD